ncbi:hypothetical protein BRYFOR_09622 [Marvinbryantia formatexigens DSM 14469]|uniref:Uncharacterized protein n=1 Tax=Marvinbryantia formatexigens DSM 14469 TaxID=478749 RepID=C6LLS3_9FIRM|nr:hypothetical protein BRYFOR_09622 [Marvinbryantia formatexigens DSM 14469]
MFISSFLSYVPDGFPPCFCLYYHILNSRFRKAVNARKNRVGGISLK